MLRAQLKIADSATRVPIRVEPSFESVGIGNATAFFYQLDGGTWLITNWHVVTGRDPSTRKILNQNVRAAIPDSLKLHYPVNVPREGVSFTGWASFVLSLYEDEDHDIPKYVVHPLLRESVDIVAIQISGIEQTFVLPANASQFELENLQLRPTLDAFVLGYPLGMFGGANFPVWKRGSIASEPDFDINGLPYFLIDTSTREGMSGSPVYVQESGLWMPVGVTDPAQQRIGTGRTFAGIYSGRIGAKDEFKVQLGLVWKARALEETIRGNVVGDSSFRLSVA